MRAPDELRDLEPHLRVLYIRFLRAFNAGISNGLPPVSAKKEAWAKSLTVMPLTEAEEELMAAFIDAE